MISYEFKPQILYRVKYLLIRQVDGCLTQSRGTMISPYSQYDIDLKQLTADLYEAAARFTKAKLGDVIKIVEVVRHESHKEDITVKLLANGATYRGDTEVNCEAQLQLALDKENERRAHEEQCKPIPSGVVPIGKDAKSTGEYCTNGIKDPNRKIGDGENNEFVATINGYGFRGPGKLRPLHIHFPDPRTFGNDPEFYKTLRGWYEGRTYEVYLDENGTPCQGPFLGEFEGQDQVERAMKSVIAHNEARICWKDLNFKLVEANENLGIVTLTVLNCDRKEQALCAKLEEVTQALAAEKCHVANLSRKLRKGVSESERHRQLENRNLDITKLAKLAEQLTNDLAEANNAVKSKEVERKETYNKLRRKNGEVNQLTAELAIARDRLSSLRQIMNDAEEELQKRNDLDLTTP